MITLHHLENSVSGRIIWLLEELGIDYTLKTYPRDSNMLAPAEFKALHRAGTAPIITDGEITLAETNAIIDYILDQHPDSTLRPSIDAPNRVAYLYWFHTSQGSFSPMLLLQFLLGLMVTNSPFLLKPIMKVATGKINGLLTQPRVNSLLEKANTDLSDNTWLTGETFTAADIIMGQLLENMATNRSFDDYPNIQRFLTHIRERPAYQTTLEKGNIVTTISKNTDATWTKKHGKPPRQPTH